MSKERLKELNKEMFEIRKQFETLNKEKKEIEEQGKFEKELKEWGEYKISVWSNAKFKEDLDPQEILANDKSAYGPSAFGLPAVGFVDGGGNLVARNDTEALKISYIDSMVELTTALKQEDEKRKLLDIDKVFEAYMKTVVSFFETPLFEDTSVQTTLKKQIEKIILEMKGDEEGKD